MKLSFKKIIIDEAKRLDFSAIATLNLNKSNLAKITQQLNTIYSNEIIQTYPEYIKNTRDLRASPLLLAPWAKSLFSIAIPFDIMPIKKTFPSPKEKCFEGVINKYALGDYHSFGKSKLTEFIDKVAEFAEIDIKTEICIDTKPLAERFIANFLAIGYIGENHHLITDNDKRGCFLCTIFTNINLPDIKTNQIESHCSKCKECISKCPTNALSDKEFQYDKCISALTMEKRKHLTLTEQKNLGNHIFGCGICSDACPTNNDKGINNSLLQIDLKWLLSLTTSELKDKIKGTALEYAGVTMLKRNALYALSNNQSDAGLEIIKNTTNTTNSSFLKEVCNKIIKSNL